MRRVLLAVLTVYLLAWHFEVMGATALGDDTRLAAANAKGVYLSGQVSHDGKTLQADDDNRWVVDDPHTLERFKGRYVTVKCRMDPRRRSLQVLSVVEEQPATKHSANV